MIYMQLNRATQGCDPTQVEALYGERRRSKGCCLLSFNAPVKPQADKPQGVGDRVPKVLSSFYSFEPIFKKYSKLPPDVSPILY